MEKSLSFDLEVRKRICELCRHLYTLGWAGGTGGGFTIREGDRIYMAPSGVQKERIQPEDIFVLDMDGEVVAPAADENLKVSACRPLFMHCFHKRNAGAVIHSHSIHAMLATLLYKDVFTITNLEMIKGIQGMGCFDQLEVPIIDNTPREGELSDSLAEAIDNYPKSQAVLVRGHGVYVWGRDWVQAKTQSECYDYLFQSAVEIKKLGLTPETGGQL